jgi:hypothetical protein
MRVFKLSLKPTVSSRSTPGGAPEFQQYLWRFAGRQRTLPAAVKPPSRSTARKVRRSSGSNTAQIVTISVYRYSICVYRDQRAVRSVIDCERGTDGRDDEWSFSVTDSGIGIGIAEEFVDKVFVIFQRLHGRDAYSGMADRRVLRPGRGSSAVLTSRVARADLGVITERFSARNPSAGILIDTLSSREISRRLAEFELGAGVMHATPSPGGATGWCRSAS